MKAILKTLKDCIKKAKQNLPIILDVIFIVTMYMILKYNVTNWYKGFIGLAILYVMITFVKLVDKKYGENSFPTVDKRFTKKLDDEVIVIPRSDWEQAVLYLNEIENYLGKE